MKDEKEEVQTVNETEIVDAKNFEVATRSTLDPLEKEERQAAKKNAKPAPKGAYIVTANIKCDKKTYKRGDEYEGKLYSDLLDSKVIVTKEEWSKR